MKKHYYSLNRYLRERYGKKLYKIALKGGSSCPNRDGTAGTGGCIFCGEGSGSFAADTIDEAISRLSAKQTGESYIAYFQSFTCTYKMTTQLKQRIMAAADDERIEIISLATRPDCLDPETMEFITALHVKKPVWVELGLQTANEESARMINRGYDNCIFDEAVNKLRQEGIEVIVHLILGLPGEKKEDIFRTIHYLNSREIQGVKLQLLHILKDTRLGNSYLEGSIEWGEDREEYPCSLEEYADLICRCIEHLREDIVIHRITGDAAKKDLLAPLWSADKKNVLNCLNRKLTEQDVVQGIRAVKE